jgi:hypothetical protein
MPSSSIILAEHRMAQGPSSAPQGPVCSIPPYSSFTDCHQVDCPFSAAQKAGSENAPSGEYSWLSLRHGSDPHQDDDSDSDDGVEDDPEDIGQLLVDAQQDAEPASRFLLWCLIFSNRLVGARERGDAATACGMFPSSNHIVHVR